MDRPYWYPRGTMPEPFEPVALEDARLVFPAGISDLMPPVEKIPDEFSDQHNKWVSLAGRLFFGGAKGLNLYPRHGIDPTRAFRHVRAILGSWEPKHEYKEAAVAYLLSLWYDDFDFDAREETE